MSRVFRTEALSTTRKRILSHLGAASARLKEEDLDEAERRDILAFFLLALDELHRLVEQTATAWEKRDYWLKADRFRHEWRWVLDAREQLRRALSTGDWQTARSVVESLEGRFPRGTGRGHKRPWRGAWEGYKAKGDRSGQAED